MKKCSKCKEEKEIELFSKDKSKKCGYKYYCKKCESITKKLYYQIKKHY